MTKISNQYSLTNILTADLANSRLGINNVSPTVALDVTGAGKFSSTISATSATFSGDVSVNSTNSKTGGTAWNLNIRDNTALAANVGGGISFQGVYTTGGSIGNFGAISSYKTNATSGNESGGLRLYYSANGIITQGLQISETGAATFSSSVSIGGADQGYQLDVKRTSTGDATFDTVANFYKASTHNTGLLLRLKNTIVDLAANNITGGGGPSAGMSFSVSSGGTISTALTLASTGRATFESVNAKVNTGAWHVLVQDNTSMAAGVGGGISFNGYKTGTSAQGVYAAIDGIKENGTSANELGAFRIWTSNGTNLAERLRITSAGNVAINNTTGTIYSKLSVAGGIAFGNNTDSNLGNKSYGNAFSKQSTVVAGGATVTIKPTIGAESSLILVSGIVEATGNRFADLILIIGAGGTPLVVGSRTFQTPATRTYTNGGENLRLQLTGSSETYVVWITGFGGNESS